MTQKDFINIMEFNEICKAIKKEADFEFKKIVNKLEFCIESHRVNDDYAENIWHGHHYLVAVNYGRKYGDLHGRWIRNVYVRTIRELGKIQKMVQ